MDNVEQEQPQDSNVAEVQGNMPAFVEEADPVAIPALPSMGMPAMQPPPVPKRVASATEQWAGRQDFSELFVDDAALMAPSRGSVEEKIQYLRERLKRAESHMNKLHEAWDIREEEIDLLEKLLLQERSTVEEKLLVIKEFSQRFVHIEEFLEQKRAEMESYAREVKDAFAQRDLDEQELRVQLEEALRQGGSLVASKQSIIDEQRQAQALKNEKIDSLQATIKHMEKELERLKDSSQGQVAELQQRVKIVEQKGAAELALQREMFENRLKQARVEVEDGTKALEEAVVEREEQLRLREDTITDLHDTVGHHQEQIRRLEDELRMSQERISTVKNSNSQERERTAELLERTRSALKHAHSLLQ